MIAQQTSPAIPASRHRLLALTGILIAIICLLVLMAESGYKQRQETQANASSFHRRIPGLTALERIVRFDVIKEVKVPSVQSITN